MRIVVIGGNGGTGAEVVRQGLARGDEVVSVSRRGWADAPAGLTDTTWDAVTPAALVPALEGADAVVVAVGGPGFSRDRARTRVTAAVLAAMARAGVSRIVVLSSLGVGDSLRLMRQPIRTLARIALGRALADHHTQEQLAAGAGVSWASVRPGGLSDHPADGGTRPVPTADARVGEPTGAISRADVAAGILRLLDEGGTGTHVFVPR